MNANKDHKKRNRAGFSMIEVLVASTILVVIVMMLGMLFQQTSLAWRTGVRRANSFMEVRSLIGSIQRDASAAIDADHVPAKLKTQLGGVDQQVFNGELNFYTLTGTGFVDDDPSKMALRSPSYITYKKDGTRTETVLKADGTPDNQKSTDVKVGLENQTKLKTTLSKIEPVFEGDRSSGSGLPLYILLQVDVDFAGNSYDIGAASAGPDKVWGTKDDIRTWLED